MSERTERRSVVTERDILLGWNCDKCGAEIAPEHARDNGENATNPRDALPVLFSGYYGGYVDCLRESPRWLLCKACADELLEAYPFFKSALRSFINREFGIPDEDAPTRNIAGS